MVWIVVATHGGGWSYLYDSGLQKVYLFFFFFFFTTKLSQVVPFQISLHNERKQKENKQSGGGGGGVTRTQLKN